MKTSDSITKISAALLKAQQAITFAPKDSDNPYFSSKYADLPTVIDAVKPALDANGIVFLQAVASAPAGFVAVTTRLLHESGEWLEETAQEPLAKNDPQGFGSAVTYLRRYALASFVGLYQDDDDANAATFGQSKPASSSAKPATPTTQAPKTPAVSADRAKELVTKGSAIAPLGMQAYEKFFVALTPAEKKALVDGGDHTKFKEIAGKVKA